MSSNLSLETKASGVNIIDVMLAHVEGKKETEQPSN